MSNTNTCRNIFNGLIITIIFKTFLGMHADILWLNFHFFPDFCNIGWHLIFLSHTCKHICINRKYIRRLYPIKATSSSLLIDCISFSTLFCNPLFIISFLPSVINPATGKELGTVPDMNEDDTRQAIQVAFKAFQTWKETTAKVGV